MDELIATATITSSLDDNSNADNNNDGDSNFIEHTAVAKKIVELKKEDIAELTRMRFDKD